MTTYSATDLATRVLRDLGLVGSEETPSAADLQWAIETATSEIQSMQARGIAIWNGSEIVIPSEYLTLLSRRIGVAIGPSFGLGDPVAAVQASEVAEMNLRRQGANPPTYAPMKTEYF